MGAERGGLEGFQSKTRLSWHNNPLTGHVTVLRNTVGRQNRNNERGAPRTGRSTKQNPGGPPYYTEKGSRINPNELKFTNEGRSESKAQPVNRIATKPEKSLQRSERNERVELGRLGLVRGDVRAERTSAGGSHGFWSGRAEGKQRFFLSRRPWGADLTWQESARCWGWPHKRRKAGSAKTATEYPPGPERKKTKEKNHKKLKCKRSMLTGNRGFLWFKLAITNEAQGKLRLVEKFAIKAGAIRWVLRTPMVPGTILQGATLATKCRSPSCSRGA